MPKAMPKMMPQNEARNITHSVYFERDPVVPVLVLVVDHLQLRNVPAMQRIYFFLDRRGCEFTLYALAHHQSYLHTSREIEQASRVEKQYCRHLQLVHQQTESQQVVEGPERFVLVQNYYRINCVVAFSCVLNEPFPLLNENPHFVRCGESGFLKSPWQDSDSPSLSHEALEGRWVYSLHSPHFQDSSSNGDLQHESTRQSHHARYCVIRPIHARKEPHCEHTVGVETQQILLSKRHRLLVNHLKFAEVGAGNDILLNEMDESLAAFYWDLQERDSAHEEENLKVKRGESKCDEAKHYIEESPESQKSSDSNYSLIFSEWEIGLVGSH